MTDWITDTSIAPHDEWVLGSIPLSEGYPEDGTISEVIIFDSGKWMDTRGTVVTPMAWARIEPFTPKPPQVKHEWEADSELLSYIERITEFAPSKFFVVGVAVSVPENGEAALIVPSDTFCQDDIIWNADVLKDILGDAQSYYQVAVNALNSRTGKH